MTMETHSRDLFWAHVAAFGALWGSLEITLGSFLHTLRFPFSGMMMASLSAVLMVAQQQLLPARGAVLAMGVVAALCKSISPGGVILGPMVGILIEAMLVQLILLPVPRSPIASALAGASCALWALSQKFLGQLVLYGGEVMEIYFALLRKAGAWLALPPEVGWGALAALAAVSALIGAAGGLVGWRIGSESRRRLLQGLP